MICTKPNFTKPFCENSRERNMEGGGKERREGRIEG
jgi:hypothetical protein